MKTPTTKSEWITAAGYYELVARSFSYPEEDLAVALCNGQYSEAFQKACATQGINGISVPRPCSEGSSTPAGSQGVFHQLRAEYTRLFIGTRKPVVSPYGSYWEAIQEGKEPVLFLSKETQEVERAMHAAGVGNKANLKEPLDHISCELEFLLYCCLVLAEAEPAREGVSITPLSYETFVENHLRNWIQSFVNAVLNATQCDFYRASVLLLEAFCQ